MDRRLVVDGKPYGLDVLIPENISDRGREGRHGSALEARISNEHRDFTATCSKKSVIELDDDRTSYTRTSDAAIRCAMRAWWKDARRSFATRSG